MTLEKLEEKVLLERLVIGLEEPILIKGVGEVMAKVDSGNGGYNVIHGENFCYQGNVLNFTTFGTNGVKKAVSKEVVDRVQINIGGGNIQDRPVIKLDVKFANTDYNEVLFSVADRSGNAEKVLICKDFVKDKLDALIDVGLTNVSGENIQYEEQEEEVIPEATAAGAAKTTVDLGREIRSGHDASGDGGKTRKAAAGTLGVATNVATSPFKAAAAVGSAVKTAGNKLDSFANWCDSFAHGRGGWSELFSTATGALLAGAVLGGAGLAWAAGAIAVQGAVPWITNTIKEINAKRRYYDTDQERIKQDLVLNEKRWQKFLGDDNWTVAKQVILPVVIDYTASTEAYSGKPQEPMMPKAYKEWLKDLARYGKAAAAASKSSGGAVNDSVVLANFGKRLLAENLQRELLVESPEQRTPKQVADLLVKWFDALKQYQNINYQTWAMYKDNEYNAVAQFINSQLADYDGEQGRIPDEKALTDSQKLLGAAEALISTNPMGKRFEEVTKKIQDGSGAKEFNQKQKIIDNAKWFAVYWVQLTEKINSEINEAFDAARETLSPLFNNLATVPLDEANLSAALTTAAKNMKGTFSTGFFAFGIGNANNRRIVSLAPKFNEEGVPDGGAFVLGQPKPAPETPQSKPEEPTKEEEVFKNKESAFSLLGAVSNLAKKFFGSKEPVDIPDSPLFANANQVTNLETSVLSAATGLFNNAALEAIKKQNPSSLFTFDSLPVLSASLSDAVSKQAAQRFAAASA